MAGDWYTLLDGYADLCFFQARTAAALSISLPKLSSLRIRCFGWTLREELQERDGGLSLRQLQGKVWLSYILTSQRTSMAYQPLLSYYVEVRRMIDLAAVGLRRGSKSELTYVRMYSRISELKSRLCLPLRALLNARSALWERVLRSVMRYTVCHRDHVAAQHHVPSPWAQA